MKNTFKQVLQVILRIYIVQLTAFYQGEDECRVFCCILTAYVHTGKPDDTYRQECYPNIKDEEIPCAGCGEWVLIDVPGVSLDEIFPIHKADEILMFGKYKGKTFGDIYKIDYQYLHWLEKTDRLFKVDFEELKQLYPDVEKQEDISIADQVIDFGKYKGQKFRDIKDDISYLEWLVSIDKISIEDFELLSTI